MAPVLPAVQLHRMEHSEFFNAGLLGLLGVVAVVGVDLLDVLQGQTCHCFSTLNAPTISRAFSHCAEQNRTGITTGLHTAAP